MKTILVIAAGLSIALISNQSAWAKQPHRAAQAQVAAMHHHRNGLNDYRFAPSPYGAYPWYGQGYGVGYAPVIGYVPSGFVGNFGGGGMSATFFGPTVAGHDYFSSPAYGHWGGFGK